MDQASVQAPEASSGRGYGFPYALYLHTAAWVLRKAVHLQSGSGESFDATVAIETPGLGEGHVRVSICKPNGHQEQANSVEPMPLVVVAEGGGFVLGHPNDGELIDRKLSDKLGAIVISVDYAKAPRYPYPHALLQLYTVLLWITDPVASGTMGFVVDSSRVAFMGNSAGGNLAAALTLLLQFTDGPCARYRQELPRNFKLVGQILLYPSVACNKPYLDRYTAASAEVQAASLPVWAASLMEASYLPPHIDKQQIFIAPAIINLELLKSLFPPSTICIIAGKDCLRYEAEEYVEKLQAVGVDVKVHEFPNAIHGFSHHKKDFQVERESCWEQVTDFILRIFSESM